MPLLLLLPLLLPPLLSLLPLLPLPLLRLLPLCVFGVVEVEVAPAAAIAATVAAAGAAATVAIANQAPSFVCFSNFLVVSLWRQCGMAVVVVVLPVIKISIVQKK